MHSNIISFLKKLEGNLSKNKDTFDAQSTKIRGPSDTQSTTDSIHALDDVLGDTSARVLKLDVEGFEIHVLRGATRALESRRLFSGRES